MTDSELEPGPDLEQALAAYLAAQRMSRRQLLERIAAVGAAAALAPVIAALGTSPEGELGHPAPAESSPAGPATLPAELPVAPAPVAAVAPAPAQAAAASQHVIARILARIVPRG
jgi:5'-nucleotidase / UDP-sugar diphosphatase